MTTPTSPAALEEKIFALLATRRDGATICPSEVARALVPVSGDWSALMPDIRDMAASLAQEGRLRVTRGGEPVDALGGGGPIRLGWPAPPGTP